MKRFLYPGVTAAILLLWAAGTYAQTYQIISAESAAVTHNLTRTVSTVQVGSHPLNRFLMTRVVKNVPAHALKGTILLLPPLGSGFQNYEVGDDGDYHRSLVGFLARHNYDIWGYSQRVQGLVPGSCESGVVDCTVIADWGLQTIIDDVAFIRQQIALVHPGTKPVIGGLSLGSMAAIASLNVYPDDYAGAILIDGTMYDADPQVRAINAGFCATFDDLLANGIVFDGQALPGFKLISQLAASDPSGPSPLPGFPPGFTNHQVFVAALAAPPLTPTTPRPGFYNLAGSVERERFFFANEALVHANIASFIDYVANPTVRDISCSLAGDTTFTDRLHDFTGAVLIFAGGHGFGTAMTDTAQLMTSASVTVKFKEVFGHVDYVFARKHLQLVEYPILTWLRQHAFCDSPEAP